MKYSFYFLLVLTLIFQSCQTPEQRERRLKKQAREQGKQTTETKMKIPNDAIFKTYTFDLGKETYNIDLPFSENLIRYFANEPKVYTYQGRKAPNNWEKDYYNMFLSNDKDNILMLYIIDAIKNLKPTMSESELVEFLVAFVQGGLAYDWDSFYSVTDKLNYPYETIFEEKGVCSDKSLVLSKLLVTLGYDIALFTFPKANHMAIGIRVSERFGSFKTNYAFIETTNYANIGIIPDNYVGNVKLESNPKVVLVQGRGRKQFSTIASYKKEEQKLVEKYGEPYLSASAKEKELLEDMHNLNKKIEKLKAELKELGCKGVVSTRKALNCKKINEELNELIDDYNDKVQSYNALNINQQS